MKRPKNGKCYLCGADGPVTRDHLPPKNLFRTPRPHNLITAPACLKCNNSASNDDEYFRMVVTGMINSSVVGKHLWNEKVVESTIPGGRIRGMVDRLISSARPGLFETPWGEACTYEADFEWPPIERVIIRITKGLLHKLHPNIDTSCLSFKAHAANQFRGQALAAEVAQSIESVAEIGPGNFRAWRGLLDVDSRTGLWIYLFFDAACYVVRHDPIEAVVA